MKDANLCIKLYSEFFFSFSCWIFFLFFYIYSFFFLLPFCYFTFIHFALFFLKEIRDNLNNLESSYAFWLLLIETTDQFERSFNTFTNMHTTLLNRGSLLFYRYYSKQIKCKKKNVKTIETGFFNLHSRVNKWHWIIFIVLKYDKNQLPTHHKNFIFIKNW